jgi:hypothetical protein
MYLFSGEIKKSPLSGEDLRLGAKDSNLCELIQSLLLIFPQLLNMVSYLYIWR